MLPQEIVNAFSFDPKNELWKAVNVLIDASIESETAYALQKENRGEDRAYHCGRAEALVSFKAVLLNTREAVLKDQGRPLDE